MGLMINDQCRGRKLRHPIRQSFSHSAECENDVLQAVCGEDVVLLNDIGCRGRNGSQKLTLVFKGTIVE